MATSQGILEPTRIERPNRSGIGRPQRSGYSIPEDHAQQPNGSRLVKPFGWKSLRLAAPVGPIPGQFHQNMLHCGRLQPFRSLILRERKQYADVRAGDIAASQPKK
jgi:hypothetical protein